MSNPEQIALTKARAILSWYARDLRTFLNEHSADQILQLDDEDKRLKRLLEQSAETVVCFLGNSGIGKSTLLNALVAEEKTIAPSGGVGPLTALATEVRYSETPRLRVRYHTKGHLWKVATALNFHVTRERKGQAKEMTLVDTGLKFGESERQEIEDEIRSVSEPDNEGSATRMDECIRTARLMVAGNQNEHRTVEYLADSLTIACSAKPQWGSTPNEQDTKRIERIRSALQMAERDEGLIQEQGPDTKLFRETLREHAAGFLSPLILKIEVGWPSSLLRGGLVLVDLPGVGVAGDVYKKETQRYVREKARAVVLVIDRSGPTDPVMDLLRTTGYWDRLVLSSDDRDADPCALTMVVTRVDDVATEEWYAIDPDADNRRAESKASVFKKVRQKLNENMRTQFEHQLAGFTQTEGSTAIRDGRESAARNLLQSLQIHPVSAIEYRRILSANDEDHPFLKTVEETGIPDLRKGLEALSQSQRDRRVARLESLTRRFEESLSNQLESIESSWRSNRATEEADRVRAALQVVLAEKNREFESRRSSFRTFLNQTVPEKIKVAVHEAKDEAQKDVNKYLRSLQDAHWATLRAAVHRGGTYLGARHINLPSDIALRFQDPVAAVWSQSLLKGIRKETFQLASDIRQIVEEICDWAAREEAAHVDEKVIETQKSLVSSQVERLRDVGKEAIEDLREVVKIKVVEVIEKPIRSRCKKFVETGDHIGPGVKHRILDMFRELALNATEDASLPTQATLISHYDVVNKEIRKAFKEWGHPLETTANAIVERHEDRTRRSDSQKRKRVLSALDNIRADAPAVSEVFKRSSAGPSL